MALFGQVVIESPLPQLDRIFDYKIPSAMKCEFGHQVSVRFGSSQKPLTGYLVGVSDSSEFAKTEIRSLDYPQPLLQKDIYQLSRMIADRQAVAIGEVLRQAVVQLTPTAQPQELEQVDVTEAIATLGEVIATRFAAAASGHQVVLNSLRPLLISGALFPEWAAVNLLAALRSFQNRKSAVLVVPDFRDVAVVQKLAQTLGIESALQPYLSKTSKLSRATDFLTVLDQTAIVIGTRLAVYAPVKNLGVIALHNDLDPSHENPQSPYLSAREIAIMRAEVTGCDLVFSSYAVSSELMRLMDIGYAQLSQSQSKPLRLSFGNSGLSIKQIVSEGLAKGAVLLLNRNAGHAAAVACNRCHTRLNCEKCASAMYMPQQNRFECRRCGWKKPAPCLYCEKSEPVGYGGGVTRTAAEYGRIFPGVKIIESSGKRQIRSAGKNTLVIATPGAIPTIDTGYQVVVIDNPQNWLNRDSMRAREHALREWFDAFSQLAPEGRGHLANFETDLARKISLGDLLALSTEEYQARKALQLPPTKRLATISGARESVSQITASATELGLDVISVSGTNPATAVIRYPYSKGKEFAQLVRRVQLATPPIEGERRRRGLKIRMDSQDLI